MHASEISTPDRGTVNSGNRKELMTDFTKMLHQKITLQGFMPLSQFMREALMHPEHGYYSAKKKVIGGQSADFVTAAEVPFFGDIIALWVIDCWQKMGTPRNFNVCELGPGRGTLMKTILQQIKFIQPQLLNFLTVHLVELGPARQEEQKENLKDFQTATGKIRWWMDVESLPVQNTPTVILANEWFDALPVTQFRYSDRGWLETCVDVDEDPRNEAHFKLMLAPGASFSNYMLPDEIRDRQDKQVEDQVELNTHGMQAMEKLAKKLTDAGKGALLVIDYGKDEHMADTLRGIRGHKFLNPLLSPGDVDLSAWVSFRQLRWTLDRLPLAVEKLQHHGPITQSEFLAHNGIDARLVLAIKDMETRQAMKYLSVFRRLMDPDEMGTSYKVFAVQTKNIPPVSPWF